VCPNERLIYLDRVPDTPGILDIIIPPGIDTTIVEILLVKQITWLGKQNFMYPSLDVPRNVVFCIPREALWFYLQELLLFAC
jgi:hypothetical protein